MFPVFFGLIFLVVAFKFAKRAAWASHAGGGGSYGGPGAWGGHSRARHGGGWYGPGPDADAPHMQPDSEPGETMSSTAGTASAGSSRQRRGSWPEGMSKARDFWNGRDVPPMVDEMFQRWHSRMHGGPSPESSTDPAKDETTAGGSLNLPPSDPPSDASSS